jgi:50S ribosomal protein L16 3-hydroxylase
MMQALANTRRLTARQVAQLSEGARDLLDQWRDAGWVHVG